MAIAQVMKIKRETGLYKKLMSEGYKILGPCFPGEIPKEIDCLFGDRELEIYVDIRIVPASKIDRSNRNDYLYYILSKKP